MNRFMKKTVAAVMSVAMLASGAIALDAPMNRNSSLFDAFSITASARSDKYTEDTLVLAANASDYSSGGRSKTWYSPNRRFELTLTTLGNLRLYDTANRRIVWQTNTGVSTNYETHTFRLAMQDDGNLVIYDTPRYSRTSNAIWNTQSVTGQKSNSISLRLSNEGELYVYHHDRRQSLWSSRSEIECTADNNNYLRSSQCLTSPNRNYRAIMQCDGNFVIYNRKDGKDIPVWDTKTANNGGAFLALQQDGNLVLYNGKTVLWASHTSTKPYADYKLSLGNDGVLKVIRKSNQAVVWSTANTTLNINWNVLKAVGRQPQGSNSCACYALAYARTILDGVTRTYNLYNANGYSQTNACAAWGNGNFSVKTRNTKLAGYQLMYDELKAGRPSVILVTNSKGRSTQHYLTVIGVKGTANRNSLTPSDFTIIDPAAYDGSSTPTAENMGTVGYDLKWDYYTYVGYNIATQN